mmetsp:Transcript_38244/g.63435  ORF Transcript_38244/g.63435 Transcript_38244/m.63435 type:complete len:516 (-) Transcript_38244:445-1992(-)|eukprot:CAMPEP_0184335370 /NCGR_PEP_ID=MMETSP1089-20130417/3942_1 /TAXON_ID=38269 ORGANISM="Gloeochaete wittrockiana, Strain SAG46.84" /NCGR_SAMPLE_ID=MMETSP1089 /ASSEMBLY_ACC=CAM_ASM_000445 /LENGTH=515 /DNA_ID=CAMNT_0026659991 /DNA_START=1 /DNA_END=1548 /DNA_ORIENTATION=-
MKYIPKKSHKKKQPVVESLPPAATLSPSPQATVGPVDPDAKDSLFDRDLIPIRLDIEFQGYRLRDSFLWNAREEEITPDDFAHSLVEDLNYPTSFVDLIAQSIRKQIGYFVTSGGYRTPGSSDGTRGKVKVDIRVNDLVLADQFEWDYQGKNADPEAFARATAAELELNGEFASSMSHAIRELSYSRDTRWDIIPVINLSRAPLVRNDEVEGKWEPSVRILAEKDLERVIQLEQREARVRRRHSEYGFFSDSGRGASPMRGVSTNRPRRRFLRGRFCKTPGVVDYTQEELVALDAQERARAMSLPPGAPYVPPWQQLNCRHCGATSKSTSRMRAGPTGNKTLCRKCSMTWLASGMLGTPLKKLPSYLEVPAGVEGERDDSPPRQNSQSLDIDAMGSGVQRSSRGGTKAADPDFFYYDDEETSPRNSPVERTRGRRSSRTSAKASKNASTSSPAVNSPNPALFPQRTPVPIASQPYLTPRTWQFQSQVSPALPRYHIPPNTAPMYTPPPPVNTRLL